MVCDFGGTLDGYCSDITRTIWTGEPSAEAKELYAVLQEAQAAAWLLPGSARPARPSTRPPDGDQRGRLRPRVRAPHGSRHRSGGHEDPYIVAGNALPLAPGHAFSVEPGIYLSGQVGARIEDIVVAAESGPRPLNLVSHDLTVVEA